MELAQNLGIGDSEPPGYAVPVQYMSQCVCCVTYNGKAQVSASQIVGRGQQARGILRNIHYLHNTFNTKRK
jgi:hypothetical protein